MDTTELVVWSRLDNFVPGHGGRGLARLAAKQLDGFSHATLPAAIAPQRRVVRNILPFPRARMGFH